MFKQLYLLYFLKLQKMSKPFSPSLALKLAISLLLLSIFSKRADTVRTLEQDEAFPPIPPPPEPDLLSFFMHDIFGGSSPSERIVAGASAGFASNTQTNGIPFSKPKRGAFPLVAGLNGARPNDQVPAKLVFGSVTVIDDELTKGQELGYSVIGRAQGFCLASSLDGSSHTMAFTALLHGDDEGEDDTLSFFGVHRTASLESQIAVVGGTEKYENARGYAKIETLQLPDQHITDGVDTILQITIYLNH